jgi:hypothetical protein
MNVCLYGVCNETSELTDDKLTDDESFYVLKFFIIAFILLYLAHPENYAKRYYDSD